MTELGANGPRRTAPTSYDAALRSAALLGAAPIGPRIRVRRGVNALVAIMCLAASACSKSSTALEPSRVADMAGRITSLTAAGAYSGSIRVEANPFSATTGAKAVMTVPASATIVLLTRAEGDFRALTVGQWVRVWFNGAVALSYPVQGTAQAIAIDSAGITVAK